MLKYTIAFLLLLLLTPQKSLASELFIDGRKAQRLSASSDSYSKFAYAPKSSAELRWFFRQVPSDMAKWFKERPEAAFLRQKDLYLLESGLDDLGIKVRNYKENSALPGVEIKALFARRSAVSKFKSLEGNVEIWCKYKSDALNIGGLPNIQIDKERGLVRFDTSGSLATFVSADQRPEIGCQLELTKLTVLGLTGNPEIWYTCGLESFGPVDSVEDSLAKVLKLLESSSFSVLSDENYCMSYPAWLNSYANRDCSKPKSP